MGVAGTLPSTWGQAMPHLRVLEVSNSFDGSLPQGDFCSCMVCGRAQHEKDGMDSWHEAQGLPWAEHLSILCLEVEPRLCSCRSKVCAGCRQALSQGGVLLLQSGDRMAPSLRCRLCLFVMAIYLGSCLQAGGWRIPCSSCKS